jgi:hypothetical protein
MRLRYEMFLCVAPRGPCNRAAAAMEAVWSAQARALSSIWVQRARIGNAGGGGGGSGAQALPVARHSANSCRWLEMPSRWYARFW